MSYKETYYQQYEKRKIELHNLILYEFKKAKSLRKNFMYSKQLILEELTEAIEKSIDYKNENIKLLREVHFSKHYYQSGFEDMIFDKELKAKYDDLESNLNFNSYHSFLKSLANYHATKEIKCHFETYWSILRSMYRLSKYEGYDSFKKFDLIQLDRDGNQAITKELKELENPGFQEKNTNNDQINLNKKQFILKRVYEKTFQRSDFYNVVTQNYIDKNSLNHDEFIKLFVNGIVLEKSIKFHCSTTDAAHFIYGIKDIFYKKLSIKYFLEEQIFISSESDRITNNNLATTKNKSSSRDFNKLPDQLAKFKK